jgi:hypothetical protein
MSYEPSSFDLAAAVVRRSADWKELLGYLATKLQSALPASTQIERAGMFGKGPVRRISIIIGTANYVIEEQRGHVAATRVKTVRGVALSHEELAVDHWVRQLTADLQRLAEESDVFGEAIRKLSLD